MVRERPTQKVVIKGGPLGARITELSIGGQNVMPFTNGFDIHASVDDILTLEVRHLMLDVDLELEAMVKHQLMLQTTVWKTNPVDGEIEKSPHKEYLTVEYDGPGDLPDAIRHLADQVEVLTRGVTAGPPDDQAH